MRPARLAVLTNPNPPIFVNALDKYPAVPRPITVEASCVAK